MSRYFLAEITQTGTGKQLKKPYFWRSSFLLFGVGGGVMIIVMKIGLTRYGLPQVFIYPAVIFVAMMVCFFVFRGWPVFVIEAVLGVVLVWLFSFFRDPRRVVPDVDNILLSPADGTVSDITTVEDDFVGGPAIRIGIFLSVFNVHINRSPCRAKVERVVYKRGRFRDARCLDAGRVNESNDIGLLRLGRPGDRLVVRQISGAIARRIVCEVKVGEELAVGQKFGMIKFGSRTELYVPAGSGARCVVEVGDKVKAGLSVLVRYE